MPNETRLPNSVRPPARVRIIQLAFFMCCLHGSIHVFSSHSMCSHFKRPRNRLMHVTDLTLESASNRIVPLTQARGIRSLGICRLTGFSSDSANELNSFVDFCW